MSIVMDKSNIQTISLSFRNLLIISIPEQKNLTKSNLNITLMF